MPRRQLLIGALLGIGSAFAFAGLSSAAGPTIETVGLSWSPSTASISTSETVTFKNSSTVTSHGLHWTGGPSTPSCPGIPGGPGGGTNWEGDCTFTQAGSYPFVCSVHSSMTGTVTVSGPSAPTVTTGAGTPTSDTEATLDGTVDPNELATEYFFKYGTTTAYGQTTSKKPAGSGSSPVAASDAITGLLPRTTYHFQLVAENTAGTTPGVDRTFTTTGAPVATTTGATGVGSTQATLSGTVNPGGRETTYFFEYGPDALYGQTTSVKSAGKGSTAVSVSAPLTGLSPETSYHFRLVAVNASGKSEGADKTLTTTPTPLPPPPEAPPADPSPPATSPTDPVGASPPATGPALGAAKVSAGKHGAPVRGSVQVLAPGAGGRLVVELRTKGKKRASAGRSVKAAVAAGNASFSVPLNARAKSALKSKGRLPLTVKIVLTPPGGAPVTVTKSVVATA
jgi:plastocyanin